MIELMFRSLRIFLLALGIWLAAGIAAADGVVVERAVFEDPTASMSVEQVRGSEFSPAPEVLYRGFRRSALWIRLTAEVPQGAGWVSVRIRPTLLDTATLYYPSMAGGVPDGVLAMDARSAQKDSRIELRPGRNTLFIRAQTNGVVLINAQILLPEEATKQDQREYLELGAILAVYAVLFIVMAALLAVRRDSLGGFFYFHLLVCLALYLFVFGHLENLLAIDWTYGKAATRLTTICNFLSFLLLMQAVQGHFGKFSLQRLTRFAAAGFGVLMLLFFVVDQHVVLAISATSGALVTIGVMVTILIMLFDFAKNSILGLTMRIITCLIAAIFIVIVCRSMLLVLGILEEGAFFLQSTVWRGVFMPLILMGFLWQRDRMQTRQLFQQKIDTAVNEVRAKDQALRLESQSQFMAMLMHELKTPLYIIQIAAASLSRHSDANNPDSKRLDNIGRAVDDLNFIIDQCVQADQLDQGDLPVNKTKVALKTLLSEVRHIKGYERITQAGISDAWVSTEFQYARIILINLITNALKYSPPGSPISLSVHTVPSVGKAFLTIRVSNTVGSAGRPDPNLVFTRYYRAEGAKRAVGAGLGLWLAKSLATKLGSDLRLGGDETLVHFDFSLELS